MSKFDVANATALRWRMPTCAGAEGATEIFRDAHPLRVYNSLTRSLTPFVPMNGRQVLWYMCGPTVYDSSHIGHARTYVAFDIVRRIFTYLGYDVLLTMNITDIDDKIIKRSTEAGVAFDVLARQHEREFLEDMRALGVAPPDVMTRVSEYVPEVVDFISGIIARGYAYASGGSVYFSVPSFQASHKHSYAKLVPENAGNKEALAEGEGVLSAGAADKKDACDFALWKASKPGEPFWDSPWGPGRPGWHIECSAMCGATLGTFAGGPIDLHTGGIDLRFPHHDNEIAQSEAYYDHSQWVNYFLHTGHLHIEGLKMSKSLKNFIKISEALEHYGPRALRFLFLKYRYNSPMNYSEEIMAQVMALDKKFLEFFGSIKAKLRSLPVDGPARWGDRDRAFGGVIAKAKAAVHSALLDDFDTPVREHVMLLQPLITYTRGLCVQSAMVQLEELANASNMYMLGEGVIPFLLRSAADYISSMFRVFGVIDPLPSIGFAADGDGVSREAVLAPVLDAVCSFRDTVRSAARSKNIVGVLQACDQVRDEALPPLGIKLEDETGKPAAAAAASAASGSSSRWKLRDPEDLRREQEEKVRAAAAKEAEKEKMLEEQAKLAAQREARARVDPTTMFLGLTDKYSAFNAEGVPTHDAAGAALSDKAVRKLQKDWDEQQKRHSTWKAKQAGGVSVAAGAASEAPES